MGICRVALINKSIRYQCNLSVELGNGPKLLGMPDYESMQLMSIDCQTTNDQHKRGQINEQTKQDKSKPYNSDKDNLCTNNKTNQEID